MSKRLLFSETKLPKKCWRAKVQIKEINKESKRKPTKKIIRKLQEKPSLQSYYEEALISFSEEYYDFIQAFL